MKASVWHFAFNCIITHLLFPLDLILFVYIDYTAKYLDLAGYLFTFTVVPTKSLTVTMSMSPLFGSSFHHITPANNLSTIHELGGCSFVEEIKTNYPFHLHDMFTYNTPCNESKNKLQFISYQKNPLFTYTIYIQEWKQIETFLELICHTKFFFNNLKV